ncbi:MAG: hypothetical protein PVH00_12435 [Gemmatimonadota bacterium]|jgi:hypothetical protein
MNASGPSHRDGLLALLVAVVGQGGGLALAGTLLGLSICVGAGHFVQPLLFHVSGP